MAGQMIIKNILCILLEEMRRKPCNQLCNWKTIETLFADIFDILEIVGDMFFRHLEIYCCLPGGVIEVSYSDGRNWSANLSGQLRVKSNKSDGNW